MNAPCNGLYRDISCLLLIDVKYAVYIVCVQLNQVGEDTVGFEGYTLHVR